MSVQFIYIVSLTVVATKKTVYYEAAGLFTELKEEATILPRHSAKNICEGLSKCSRYSNIEATRVTAPTQDCSDAELAAAAKESLKEPRRKVVYSQSAQQDLNDAIHPYGY